MKICLLGLCIFMTIYQITDANESFCQVFSESCGPFLPRIPRKYSAQIELTIPLANQTVFIREIVDNSNFRSSVSVISEGLEYRNIFDFKTKENVKVVMSSDDVYDDDNLCSANTINDTSDLGLSFLLPQFSDNINIHIFAGSGALHLNPDMRFAFVNDTVRIREIPTLHWKACYNPPNMNGSFLIDYFWSDPSSWTPASGDKSVPLLASVNETVLDNNTIKSYYYTYSFINFQSNIEFSDVDFEIPRGIFCYNYNRKKPFPVLPKQFTYFMETIVDEKLKQEKLILNYRIWFDSKSDLIRVDFKNVPLNNVTGFESREMISIIDFHSDVVYNIDKDLKNCTLHPLNSSALPVLGNGKEMLTAQDLFKLNITEFEYTGKSYVRDIFCDVWIGEKGSFTYEWYFLSEDWVDDVGKYAEKRVPIQVIRYNHRYNDTVRYIVSIYQFERNYDGFPFDVSTCSGNALQKHFQVSFSGSIAKQGVDIVNVKNIFQRNIAEAISLPQLRISNLEIIEKPNEDYIVIEFTLLEKPSVAGKPVNAHDKDDPVLDEAQQYLENVIKNGKPVVEVEGLLEATYFSPITDSLVELDSRDPCRNSVSKVTPKKRSIRSAGSPPYVDEDQNDAYESGQVVGLAIGLFIIGVILGVITVLLGFHFTDGKPPAAMSNMRMMFRRSDPANSNQPSVHLSSERNESDYHKLEEEADA